MKITSPQAKSQLNETTIEQTLHEKHEKRFNIFRLSEREARERVGKKKLIVSKQKF
jgi:hypothetical protein